MSQVSNQHHATSPASGRFAVLTLSDSRTLETDRGGSLIVDLLAAAGHQCVVREIVPDESARIEAVLKDLSGRPNLDGVLMTGGTGISCRDQTFECVSRLITKTLPGYGELFRMLSYQQIGPAAMLSRAVGGLIGRLLIFTMPGSPDGVRLAMEKVILPEVGHLLREARR